MNLIIDTIKFLFGLKREPVVEIDGRKYFDTGDETKPVLEPGFPSVTGIQTLTGLADYLESDADQFEGPVESDRQCFIIVESYRCVKVVTAPYGSFLQRDLIIDVFHHSDYDLDGHDKGRLEMDIEGAQRILLSWFQPTHDQEYVLNLISNIVITENEKTIRDDGIKQKVSLQTGVTTVAEMEVKRIVKLQPYVTFAEIEQPVIPYVLRLKQRGSEIFLHLTPVKDPEWRMQTKEDVIKFLSNRLAESHSIFY